MLECLSQALGKADIGIIILNPDRKIIFWNEKMENISGVSAEKALNRHLEEVCPKLHEPRYQNKITDTFINGQSWFCSAALHKAFIWPENNKEAANIRQNLNITPIFYGRSISYLMLQISDITEHFINEQQQKALISELQKGYQRVKESEKAIREEVKYDVLTGVLNRHMLENELESALTLEDDKKTALLFIDLDGFKTVNDRYGHIVGDVLLQQVAGRLKNNTRQDEEFAQDMVARIGGDEFLLWFHFNNKEEVIKIAQRIVSTIHKPYFIDNIVIEISVSIGIAVYPDNASSIKNLIKYSDSAMYHIKQTTKNDFCFYTA